MFKIISTEKAPWAIGPYSQAVVSGNLVFLSGQIPIDPSCNEVIKGDISAQTQQVINNIIVILKESGCTIENVIKTTVFLQDMKDFEKMNLAYAGFFKHKPARSTVQVACLPKKVLVEIECIAIKE